MGRTAEAQNPPLERAPPTKRRLFAEISKEDLLGYGVPAEWLDDVRNANEDTLLELADHLPSEAAEALLNLATGGAPMVAKPAAVGADPRISLGQMDDFPTPSTAHFGGARLQWPCAGGGFGRHGEDHRCIASRGLPGSGKSGRQSAAYDLSDTLANALRIKLRRLISTSPLVGAVHAAAVVETAEDLTAEAVPTAAAASSIHNFQFLP